MTTKTGTRAAIYCRFSLDRDGRAEGVNRQLKDCRALARAQGLTVADVFTDNDTSAYSGKSRPEFERMMANLARYDALIIWKQDRLTRRVLEFFDVVKKCNAAGVRLLSVNDNIDTASPMGQAISGLFAGLAEQESANTSLRVARASQDRAAAGRPHGSRRPYGYEKDGMTIVEAEAEVIREAVARVLRGESMNAVASDFNRRGMTSATGRSWGVTQLRQMLVSARIAGLRTHQGATIGKAAWIGIITEAEHERVCAVLNGRSGKRRQRAGRYFLSGKLTCGRCGGTLHSAFRGDGNNDRRYVCTPAAHRVGCGLAVSATAIEEFLRDAVAEVVSSPTVRAAMRPAKPGKPVVDVHALEQQLVQLGLDHDAGLISRSEWLARRGPLSERLDAAHAERAADEPDLSDLADAPDPAERFRGFSIDRQRAVLDRLIGTITVKPATRRGRGFDENRVRPVWKV